MKKLLLTSLLGLFGFVGAFASAGDISIVGGDSSYTPSSITFDEDFNISFNGDYVSLGDEISVNCSTTICELVLKNSSDSSKSCDFYKNTNGLSANGSINGSYGKCTLIPAGTYTVNVGGEDMGMPGMNDTTPLFSSFVFLNAVSDSAGGDNSGGANSGLFLPNGIDDLKPIIGGLESTMAEFVPYIAYIGLGIVVAVLGFVAIRRLVNRVRAKIFDSF